MSTVSKFTEKELEILEAETELKIYKIFQSQNPQLGLPSLNQQEEKNFRLGYQRCAPKVWEFFDKAPPSVKQRLFTQAVFQAILSENEIDRYELVCNNLETFMLGSRDSASSQEKMAYRNFKYYKELSSEAMKYFRDHFARTDYFGFSSSAYEQWFASLRLGLNSNPERVLHGASNLNYPDLNPRMEQHFDYNIDGAASSTPRSPRLDALKAYLTTIYELRIKVQLLDILIRQAPKGNNPNVSMGQWEKFINSTRQRLHQKFGSQKGEALFKKMFGSSNPSAPTSQADFNTIQNDILDKISAAILKEQLGETWEPEPTPTDGFHRDYAKEQQEREKREEENRKKKEQEQKDQDWGNIDPTFKNNPNLVKEWTSKGFTKEQVKEWLDIGLKPQDSELAQFLKTIKNLTPEQVLNEGDINQLKQEFQQWKTKPEKEKKEELKEKNNKKDNIDDKDKPKPTEKDKKRDKSPSRKAAEDKVDGKEVPPPKHTEFNSSDLNDALNSLSGALDKDSKDQGHDKPFTPAPGLGMPLNTITKEQAEKLPWLVMGFDLKECRWFIKDPTTAANFRHGSGDIITLLLELWSVSRKENFCDVGHNFFYAKNPDKKGYERLVKDETEARSEAEKKEREKDEDKNLLIRGKRSEDTRANKLGWKSWPWRKDKKIPIGVPGVKQKSWRFTRFLRSQHKAYDLKDNSHLIGKLYEKNLIQTFRAWSTTVFAPSPEPKSLIWITNQLKYPRKENVDWWGDDAETINPNNGFSHYIIFCRDKHFNNNDDKDKDDIYNKFINNKTPALNCKTLAELVGKISQKGNAVVIRIGPDALELIASQTKDQKGRSEPETPETRKNTDQNVSPQDIKDMGLTPEEYEALKTAFTDPAHIANILKKLAQSPPEKMAEMLNKMFDTIHEKTRDNMFNQMVDNNPVFNEEEKQKLKETWNNAKTKEDKKKVWETLTSHQAQREAHKNKTQKEKDKIFEEQVNKNPRYGPPGVDTQERRDRFEEYTKADETKKEKMQEEENEKFTTGENANQWGNYFQDNAQREAGAGDESVGTESDNNFSGQFSFADSLQAINKLKNIGSMKPEGMEEGMKANKPYWEVVFSHPLTYIFLFIGIIIAIMAAATRKNRS